MALIRKATIYNASAAVSTDTNGDWYDLAGFGTPLAIEYLTDATGGTVTINVIVETTDDQSNVYAVDTLALTGSGTAAALIERESTAAGNSTYQWESPYILRYARVRIDHTAGAVTATVRLYSDEAGAH